MVSRPHSRSRLVDWLARDGWTLMIVLGPRKQSRRLHVPRWALLGLCCAWLGLMMGVAWLGFESAAPVRAQSHVSDQNGARMATAPVPTSRQ